MTSSRKWNIIIALILAVALWVYVVGELDPATTRTFRNVTVKYIGEDTLQQNGLAVEDYGVTELSVTLTGKRSRLNKLKAEDIEVVCDLSGAAEGTNTLSVRVIEPTKTDLKRQSVEDTTVTIGKYVTETRDVKISYSGSFADDEEPTTLSLDPEQVTVSGAEKNVKAVSYVSGTIPESDVKAEAQDVETDLIPVNGKGAEVSNVTLSTDTVKVSTVRYQTKEVSLVVPVTDNSEDDLTRTYEAPDTITVKGLASDLKSVDSITAESIDITDITEDTSIEITPILPDGVQLADQSKTLKLKVKVTGENEETVSFEIPASSIEVKDVESGLTATLDSGVENVKVTISGTKSQLAKISESDLTLSVSLKGMTAGTNTVDIDVTCKKEYAGISLDPSSIAVELKE